MVLLVRRGGHAIDRRRMGKRLVLAGQRGRGHLRDHETGVQPPLFHQKRRQLRQVRVDQQRDPPLRKRPDLGDGQRQIVGGQGHRLGVKVAARDDFIVLGENDRVVRNGVRLDGQHPCGLANLRQARPHHLRLAAQRIWVLHLFAVGVGLADIALFVQQMAICGGRVDLPSLATNGVQSGVERHAAPQRGID